MKTVRKIHTGGPNCSCTSCIYKGESENPSVKRFIAHGSRIDRLYYGKYIPLRERKLLDRLVRTRAVYDDIRAKLLSDSTLSLTRKPGLKIKNIQSSELDDDEKGSAAIFEMVDLVDKGATLGSSDCCSCCSCGSNIIRESERHVHHTAHGLDRRAFKDERHVHHTAHGLDRRAFKDERHAHHTAHGLDRRAFKEERVVETHRRNRKGVRFNTKRISSDPCRCTIKFSGKFKKRATEIFKRKPPPESIEFHTTTDEDRRNRQKKLREFASRSYENIKQINREMEGKFIEGIKMVKESKTKIQENLNLDTQQSALELKQAQRRLKTKVRESEKKKINKDEIQLNDLLGICMCPEDEIFENPNKESMLSIYTKRSKEKLIEAKGKITSILKSAIERKSKGKISSILESTVGRKPKVRKIASKGSQIQISHKYTVAREPKARKASSQSSESNFGQGENIGFQLKKDSLVKYKEDLIRKNIMKEWECEPECVEGLCDPEECLIKLEERRKKRAVIHRGVGYEQIMVEKRTGPVLHQKNVKVQGKALKTHDKAIVIKTIGKRKQKPILRTQETESITRLASGDRFNEKEINKKMIKRDIADKTQVREIVETSERKSNSKQGVRISSSFSLNVQFYKGRPDKDISTVNIKETVTKQSPAEMNYKMIKHSKVQGKVQGDQGITHVVTTHSSRDTQTKVRSLKRCFCTLKLKPKGRNTRKQKAAIVEKSIVTHDSSATPCKINCSTEMCQKMLCEKLVNTSSKTQTNKGKKIKNKKQFKKLKLLPYECEPGVCTPGECDPYQCIKLINIREAKAGMRSVPCTTCPSRKIKSTSTITSKSNKASNAKFAITPKSNKASNAKFAQSLYSYNTDQKRNERQLKLERRNIPRAHGRQAVRIGSTFSFNIEFYRTKPQEYLSRPSDLKTLSIKPKYKPIPKKKFKDRAYQGDIPSLHRNKPTQMHRKEKDASISTALKRCFCTLKLQKKEKVKIKRNKMLTTGTKTEDEVYLNKMTSNKGTKTRRKYIKTLKPYECEPFTCIPGECNPYECLERIKRRNLRDVGVSSFKRSDNDRGSSTSEKSLKTAVTQSKPKSKEKKVLTKAKKVKQSPKAKIKPIENYSNYSSSAKSKQAVKIGSTFSFNVEFSKNKPVNNIITKYHERPTLKLDTRPETKNQGVKIKKTNVADLNTQMKLKRRDKAATTKPLLKRCFCTLNLQKRKGNVATAPFLPQVYTVNTAIVKDNRRSILKSYCNQLLKFSSSAKLNATNRHLSATIKSLSKCKEVISNEKIPCKRCYSVITNIHKHETLKLISQTYLHPNNIITRKVSREHSVKSNNNLKRYLSEFNKESISYTSRHYAKSHMTAHERNTYSKSYFWTMNLQVQKNNMTVKKEKMSYPDLDRDRVNRLKKLKPYECEPGICVPGECDPYECLKLMSKRGSNYTKKTGTDSAVSSASINTNLTPKFKSYKVQSLSQKTTKPQLAYADQHTSGSKKVVRVGSKFSFDIEFSKNSIGSHIDPRRLLSRLPQVRPPKLLSKFTGINKNRYRDRQSQSVLSRTFQKASATLPMMKRCFCTLKLQKKGRVPMHDFKMPTESLQTDPIIPELTTTDRGQNTGKFKPVKFAHNLQPYECIPGICTPGQCNPYECLEIMKKYNQTTDFGIDARRPESKSVGSMFGDYRKHKNRGVNFKYRDGRRRTFSEGRHRHTRHQAQVAEPTKQVVRVGSSFSFDIEFHKNSGSAHPKDYIPTKLSREDLHTPHRRRRYVKRRQRGVETSTPKHHKQLQFRNRVHAASTMTTSFMKRCFCVLKLRKNNKNITTETNYENVPKPVSKPEYIDKKINTKHYKERVLHLEPYECEPGICIPGECDPYVCEKLIKQRQNLETRSSSTPSQFTRSTSSNSPRYYKRNVNTQFRPKRTSGDTIKQVYTKTKIHDSNRQVVRIGSNFSFDIEFYKNKSPNFDNYHIPKTKTDERLYVEPRRRKGRNAGTNNKLSSFKSQHSQMNVNKRDFGAGLNNVLKRCFCTLQLRNQHTKKDTAKELKEPVKNEFHSKNVMTTENNKKLNLNLLEPYECEPNFCIPYECDPYECEKRIKLRQKRLRESGMSTHHPSTQSVASLTHPYKRTQKRTQSISVKTKDRFRRPKIQNNIYNTPSKQCVKIGSSFSFDIEFFKNKGAEGLQLDQKPKYHKPMHTIRRHDRVIKRTRSKARGLQSMTHLNSKGAQAYNEFMKTQSTMARLAVPLKRCFCTLTLRKDKNRPRPVVKPTTTNVSTETKARGYKIQPLPKLLPYECEPNICVPNECNPLECLEHIKARLQRQKDYGTSTNYTRKSKIGTSMAMPHTRNKRLQWKSLGHVQNKHRTSQLLTSTPGKQAVKIGSNFSFNVEFYKQRGFEGKLVEHNKPIKYKRKPLHTAQTQKVDRRVNNMYDYKMKRSHGNQSAHVGQESRGSAIEPFLKRCFCTLKLQKKPVPTNQKEISNRNKHDIQKVSKPAPVSTDRGTITKKYKNHMNLSQYECEPYTCVPGECDPYECLKRIKERYSNSRNMSTQMVRECFPKCISTDLGNFRSKKLQSDPYNDNTQQSNLVEVPRFGNLFNPQAVKIGSNFSFNIEFYKELLPPKFEVNEKDESKYGHIEKVSPTKYNTNAVMTSPTNKYHNRGSQGYNIKTENKGLEIGNALKRCFCTLKLQKEINSKHINPKITNAQFPQVVEVRRVSVKNNECKCLNNAGTNTKAKNIKNTQEMEVIHPYSPNKFNKTKSKTVQNTPVIETSNKSTNNKISNRGKRLTRKKSKRALSQIVNPTEESTSILKKIMCKCANMFSSKTKSKEEVIAKEHLSKKNQTAKTIKKKNVKVGRRETITNYPDPQYNNKLSSYCPAICPYMDNNSSYQTAGSLLYPAISLNVKNKRTNDVTPTYKKSRSVEKKTVGRKEKTQPLDKFPFAEKDHENSICSHCKITKMKKQRSQPLKVHFLDSPKDKKDISKKAKLTSNLNKSVDQIDEHRKAIKNKKRKEGHSRKRSSYCEYCTECGIKLNNEEIQKASGDQKNVTPTNQKNVTPTNEKIKNLFHASDTFKNLFNFNQSVDNICSAKGPEKPLFEMHVDSDHGGILNKDEIINKVKIYSKKNKNESIGKNILAKVHGKSCRCCICLGKKHKTGEVVHIKRKNAKPTGKPCICGSTVCADKLGKMKIGRARFRRMKPCDCGSPICAKETKKMRSKIGTGKITCICEAERLKKLRIINEKKRKLEEKRRDTRLERYRKEDKIRYAKRRKENRRKEKKLSKNVSDSILMAESVIDIGKLGVTAFIDTFRFFVRSAVDPKHAYRRLKNIKEDPILLSKYLKSCCEKSGARSTARRVRLRCLSMRGVKTVKRVLESHAFTNYLLHIASDDQKKRLPKRKPRERDQLDFNCSLYMGSLRRRPFLWMYNKYPWFYPHFLAILNVWKQFIDIALFLLAVVVWSPCIFCMEACRAIMCCFFCTG